MLAYFLLPVSGLLIQDISSPAAGVLLLLSFFFSLMICRLFAFSFPLHTILQCLLPETGYFSQEG